MSKRREQNSTALLALGGVLRLVVENPGRFVANEELQQALASQNNLAKYEDSDIGLLRMSLNTQKQLSETLFGGYDKLDQLRLQAKDAIAAAKSMLRRSSKRSKAGLIKRVIEQEHEIQLLLEDLQLLQRAFERRCAQARSYAKSSEKPSIVALCQIEQREIDAGLELRRRPPNLSNVTPIGSLHDSD